MKVIAFFLASLSLVQAATATTDIALKKGEGAVVCESDLYRISAAVSKLNKRLLNDLVPIVALDEGLVHIRKPFAISAPTISISGVTRGSEVSTVCVTLTKQ